MKDIFQHVDIWQAVHAQQILEVLGEVFDDIDLIDETDESINDHTIADVDISFNVFQSTLEDSQISYDGNETLMEKLDESGEDEISFTDIVTKLIPTDTIIEMEI